MSVHILGGGLTPAVLVKDLYPDAGNVSPGCPPHPDVFSTGIPLPEKTPARVVPPGFPYGPQLLPDKKEGRERPGLLLSVYNRAIRAC